MYTQILLTTINMVKHILWKAVFPRRLSKQLRFFYVVYLNNFLAFKLSSLSVVLNANPLPIYTYIRCLSLSLSASFYLSICSIFIHLRLIFFYSTVTMLIFNTSTILEVNILSIDLFVWCQMVLCASMLYNQKQWMQFSLMHSCLWIE